VDDVNALSAAAWVALVQHSLLFTATAMVVVLIRMPARRLLGAGAVYTLWLLPALAQAAALASVLLAAWLPAAASVVVLNAAPWPAWAGITPPEAVTATTAATATAALALWALGAVSTLAVWAMQHHRVLARLAPEPRPGHTRPSGSLPLARWLDATGPALVGVWRPRVCVPADFEQRFSPAEQQAVLAHEAAHARRHDNAWNLLAAAAVALQWFNPLAWWAWRCLRADQELSADAQVLFNPTSPGAAVYASALLKSQGLVWPSPGLPTAAPWFAVHPLTERVRMLKDHRFSVRRLWLSRGLLAGLGLLSAGLGQALHAQTDSPAGTSATAPADNVMLLLAIEVGGNTVSTPRLWGALGKPMAVRWTRDEGAASNAWELEFVTTAQADGKLLVQSKLSSGIGIGSGIGAGTLRVMSTPRLIVEEGSRAQISLNDERASPPVQSLRLALIAQRMAAPDLTRPGPSLR